MSDAPKHEIPASLFRSMKNSGAEIAGHREIAHATQYKLSRGPENANLNVYHTGKISVDGKASGLKSLLESWRTKNSGAKKSLNGSKNKIKSNTKGSEKPVANATPRVGTDEAGKGDYFGPLVVAGVRILGETQDRELREAGVRDSKDLSASQTQSIASLIKAIVGPENICVISLSPPEYDRRRKDAGANVNRLLGEMDVEIISKLKSEVEVAIVDEFGPRARSYIAPHMPAGVRLEVRPRAEDDTAVAAASILARARYLSEMELLSEEVGFELPRGSTHVVNPGVRVAKEKGVEELKRVAKDHFSTTGKVLEKVRGEKR